jgi:hypothetical protein
MVRADERRLTLPRHLRPNKPQVLHGPLIALVMRVSPGVKESA